ncbi:MAG: hypothetical protein WCG26_10000, partial [Chloroflexales bacterium]
MADLEARLRMLFNERSVRRLAPASLLAVSCGVAIGGMMLGAPAFAAGAGVVIGNITVNIASTWIERLFMLPVEAEAERIELMEEGLAAREPGALAVAAATLAAAGPQVAAALPAASRAALITTVAQGMREAGGPLAALAPTYAAALRTPDHADWANIQAEVQQQIRISARVEAGERATIERSGIAITTTGATVDASVVAGPDARIRDSAISIQGVRPPLPVAPEPPHYGINAGTGSTIHNSPLTVINHPDPEAARREGDLIAYLRRTLHECNALPLDKLDQTDATHIRAMELACVYIALDTTDSVKADGEAGRARTPERPDDQRPLSAIEVLARAQGGRAMLLGAPGSGKSTFVSYLTYCLAGAALAARRPADPALADDWLSRLPRWSHGALLPVPIILRDLAALPSVAAARQGTAALITDLLVARTAELGCPHAAEALVAALREGRALLLLDGFDEVVGETVLPRMAEAIRDAATVFPGPILVTCRVLDYQEVQPVAGQPQRPRQVAGFAPFTLADLRDEQVSQFIGAWYRELAASGRRTPAAAAAAIHEMQGAVQSRDELRALANTPLLLTLMAQVHAFRGTLPTARALLYAASIELLLLRWRQPRDQPDLMTRLGLSNFGSGELLTLMARLGYEAHTLAERDQRSSGPADLSEEAVLKVLKATFGTYDEQRKGALAEIVLHALVRGNGLLLKRGPEVYTFAHRTFQEFLAGYYLKGQRNAQQLCR